MSSLQVRPRECFLMIWHYSVPFWPGLVYYERVNTTGMERNGATLSLFWNGPKKHPQSMPINCWQNCITSHFYPINPLIPRSDYLITSPPIISVHYPDNSKLSGRSCFLDVTPNSRNLFIRKCVATRGENLLGSSRVKWRPRYWLAVFCSTKQS